LISNIKDRAIGTQRTQSKHEEHEGDKSLD